MDTSCYNNVIGLSPSDCSCFETNRPQDYNTSLSGLYISDLEALKSIDGLANCENGSLWDIMISARDNAIKAFIADTNALLLENFALQRQPFYGGIGEKKARDIRSLSEMYAGIRISCDRVNSGVLIIKEIGTIFDETGTITLQIYNSFNEKVGSDISLNTEADKAHINILENPIELPLFSKYGKLEYFFVYLINKNPKANQVNCNCGQFKPVFNTYNPYYKKTYSGANAWANYLMVGGFETDALTEFDGDMPVTTSNYMNGLFLGVEIKCKVQETLCKDSFDFEGNPLAISMAHAIRYKAAELIADSILRSGDPNLATLVNSDALSEARDEWIDRYNEMTLYISSNVSVQTSDCLCEKNILGLSSKSVFA